MRLQPNLKGEAGRARGVATSFLGNVVLCFSFCFKHAAPLFVSGIAKTARKYLNVSNILMGTVTDFIRTLHSLIDCFVMIKV